MAVLVDEILDKLTHTTVDNCMAYAWWDKHRGKEFKDVIELWLDSKVYSIETSSMIIGAFWKKFDDDTRLIIKNRLQSLPELKRAVSANTRLTKNERRFIK